MDGVQRRDDGGAPRRRRLDAWLNPPRTWRRSLMSAAGFLMVAAVALAVHNRIVAACFVVYAAISAVIAAVRYRRQGSSRGR